MLALRIAADGLRAEERRMLVSGLCGLACGVGVGAFLRVGAVLLVHLAALPVAAAMLALGAAGLVGCLEGLTVASLTCQAGFLLSAASTTMLRTRNTRRVDVLSR